MQWTRRQRKVLRRYRDYGRESITIARALPLLLPALAIYSLAAVAAALLFDGNAKFFFLGALVGAALRVIVQVHNLIEVWPVAAAVVDWDKVNALNADLDAAESSP